MSDVPAVSSPSAVPSGHRTEQILAYIDRHTMLRSLPVADRLALSRILQLRHYDPGINSGLIFSDGDRADTVFFVVSGEVAFHVVNAVGTKVYLTPAMEGESFGEVAVLSAGKRTATARAVSPSVLLEAEWNVLRPLLRNHPDLLLAMFTETARRLGQTSAPLRTTTIQNPNDLIRSKLTPGEERMNRVARFCGSVQFLAASAIVLSALIVLIWFGGKNPFDSVAYNILALGVSLTSLAVTCIVLHSQYQMADRERVRNDAETAANLRAEQEILHLHEKVNTLSEELRSQLPQSPQGGIPAPPGPPPTP